MTGGVKFISDVAVCHTHQPLSNQPTNQHCPRSASLADDKDDDIEDVNGDTDDGGEVV